VAKDTVYGARPRRRRWRRWWCLPIQPEQNIKAVTGGRGFDFLALVSARKREGLSHARKGVKPSSDAGGAAGRPVMRARARHFARSQRR